jgi:hypothetical protein
MADNEIGTIFSAAEADNQFGQVQSSVEMSSSGISSLLNQTTKYLMFSIKEEKLYILGDARSPIFPDDFTPGDGEVFAVYSKSKIEELLNTGRADAALFEKRNDVFSITNGNLTLENGTWCPPFC